MKDYSKHTRYVDHPTMPEEYILQERTAQIRRNNMVLVDVRLELNGHLNERMLKYCKENHIKEEDLIVKCLQHCESKNYF